jgi:hypothetical protein
LKFRLFANPQLHGSPVSDENCSIKAKSQRSDSPINSDNHTIFSTADINKDQSVTLSNDNPIIHCSDEGNDLNMPKGSKDYTLPVNSLIQNASTKISTSEISSVPNMNNLEKDRSKENLSKSNTSSPFILPCGWCIKGDCCDFFHQNLINAPSHARCVKKLCILPFFYARKVSAWRRRDVISPTPNPLHVRS